jgi:5-methylthioadenosine/S-adenosylhomocysteine deaminase
MHETSSRWDDPMTEIVFTNATLLPLADDGPAVIDHGWLHVRDDRIVALGDGAPPSSSGETRDLAGAFLAPGFVSSHGHLATSGSRGLAVDSHLYDWCTAMYGVTRGADPDDIYWCTLHGALDYVQNGVTTAFDFTEGRQPWQPMVDGRRLPPTELRPVAFSTRQVDAKVDSGIRFVNGIPLDDAIGTREEVLARLELVLRHTAGVPQAQALRSAIAGAVQWADTEATAQIEVEAMRRWGLLNQAHFLETPEHVELQRSKFAWYDRAGALGPDLVFGHFIQVTDEIVARAAETGCGMSWQPVANGRLGSGVAPIPQLRDAGMRIGLGLDDQAASDVADPWGCMRIGLYAVRVDHRDPTALAVADVLRAQTLGAAEVLGVDDRVGSLEPGKFADLLVVDPTRPDIGPLWDPVASYVLACGLRNLREVWIGGRLEAVDGISRRPIAERVGDEVRRRLS